MKKHLILFLVVLVSFSFTSTTCTKSEKNLCDATEQNQISRAFIVSAHIIYDDLKVYQGEFKFDIYKVYCSGKVSGHYWDRFDTNESGEWFSGMRYEYDYANSQDEVVIEFTIANPGGPDHVEVEKFRYSEVENNDDEIFFTCNIRLPWQAPWE